MRSSIITIGGFDGVHLGHQALVRRAVALAGEWHQQSADRGAERPLVCAMVLDPSPAAVLRPQGAPPMLMPFEQRITHLREAGADMVVRLAVTPELLELSPEAFVHQHLAPLRPAGIVEGPDFRFGKSRAGDVHTVARAIGRADFLTAIHPSVEVALGDHTLVPARSTMVRWLVAHGRVADAARVLGRPHTLHATVVRGERRGRTIGFPTANLRTECMLPADGVYAARARLPDGRTLAAALSVGVKPTFGVKDRTAEAFLFTPGSGDPSLPHWAPITGLPEYDWPIALEVIAWVREQYRFPGLEALVAQIRRDCQRIEDLLAIADTPSATPAGQEIAT